MTSGIDAGTGDDPFRLERFVTAQQHTYASALAEITQGRKTSHWMWYIFPQLAGLGRSEIAARYAISSLDEARAYLRHPLLATRLMACAEAALGIDGRTAVQIFGHPDDLKLRSSATLFAEASAPGSVFHRLLDKYWHGQPDVQTLAMLEARQDDRNVHAP